MISIPLRPLPIRILFFLLLAAGLGWLGWRVIRTAIGDSVMSYVQRAPNLAVASQLEGADLAGRFSPDDPVIRWQRGGVYLNAAAEEQEAARLAVAIEELQRATRQSPADYRLWLSLGRARERAGEPAEARRAIERAAALAPNHFDPRWAFGNHLLRAGDREASFAQMRLALVNRPSALPLVFDYAWNAFQGDGRAVIAALDPAPELKPKMIVLLINRGRVEDGLVLWRSLPAPAPDDLRDVTEALLNAGRHRMAHEIWSGANLPDRPQPDAGSLLANGGFEDKLSNAPFYSWRLLAGNLAKLLLDRKAPREGRQSLRIGFDLSGNVAFTIAVQTVPVKPSTAYRLRFWAKVEEMESLSTPIVELYDPALELNVAGRVRVATPPLPNRTVDWTEYRLDLTTTAATEALKLRVQRPPCPEPPCPISGRIWLDAFQLAEATSPLGLRDEPLKTTASR
jgi:tetratricopeptide (TPR) repeat protein